MIFNRSKKFLTLLILLYFGVVAVSPVSALFPSAQLDKYETNDVLKKHKSHADFLYLDLALWEGLKRTKPSDESIGTIFTEQKDKHAKDFSSKICDGAREHIKHLLLFPELAKYNDTSLLALFTTPRLTYSGLSPPFLS